MPAVPVPFFIPAIGISVSARASRRTRINMQFSLGI